MLDLPHNLAQVDPRYDGLLQHLGLTGESVFTHPAIRVWRSIPERENCVLDGAWPDGCSVRLHIKRHQRTRMMPSPAQREAEGIQLLAAAGIPTVPLVAWGELDDGRSFLITEDLNGWAPADKLIAAGLAFDEVLGPTAELAASLHSASLHHRDLYLCHFLLKPDGSSLNIRLIDAGRVAPLPRWILRNRWIVKDLSQFWYSTLALPISDAQRLRWLGEYCSLRGIEVARLRNSIERKSRWIARHDARLKRSQPTRNVSLEPGGNAPAQ